MALYLTTHAISDGHPYNGKTVGWAVAGEGQVFIAPFLTTAMDKARAAFPGDELEFREGHGVDDYEVPGLVNPPAVQGDAP
jgi:hypothetical protein